MATRGPAYVTSPTNSSLGEIQTIPERRPDMPYAPAIRVEAPGDLLFISGATPSPLYHKHPHVFSEHNHPVSIKDQTRLAMENIKTILDHQNLTWTDVDLDNWRLRFAHTKNDQPRFVPLVGRAQAVLKAHYDLLGSRE